MKRPFDYDALAKAIARWLGEHGGGHGAVAIATATGLSTEATWKALGRAEALGLVTRQRFPRGRMMPDQFRPAPSWVEISAAAMLLLPKFAAAADPDGSLMVDVRRFEVEEIAMVGQMPVPAGDHAALTPDAAVKMVFALQADSPNAAAAIVRRGWRDLWDRVVDSAHGAGLTPGAVMAAAIEAGLPVLQRKGHI